MFNCISLLRDVKGHYCKIPRISFSGNPGWARSAQRGGRNEDRLRHFGAACRSAMLGMAAWVEFDERIFNFESDLEGVCYFLLIVCADSWVWVISMDGIWKRLFDDELLSLQAQVTQRWSGVRRLIARIGMFQPQQVGKVPPAKTSFKLSTTRMTNGFTKKYKERMHISLAFQKHEHRSNNRYVERERERERKKERKKKKRKKKKKKERQKEKKKERK